MARQKRATKHATYYISTEVLVLLDKYCEDTGIPKTTIVEKALKAYLDKKEVIDSWRDKGII